MSAHLPYGQQLTVRPEVFDPRGLVSVVDLSLVTQRRTTSRKRRAESMPVHDAVLDPKRFFEITYPTHEIVQTLQVLAARFSSPESVPGTVLLSGHYGSGKSHVMLAAHHALKAPDLAKAWAEQWGLPELHLPADPLVLTRSFIQRAEGNLWDVLLEALELPVAGDSAYMDGEQIEALLPDRPVVMILDELERWYDAQAPQSRSRNRNFLQALTEVSMRVGGLTVVTSVLGEHPEPADTIRRVKPLELSFKSSEDRQRVVQYRLFADRLKPAAEAAAKAVASTWAASYRAAGLPDVDTVEANMAKSWPFSPELMDILTKKVPAMGGFMNTRGTLRFLANVVRATHDTRAVVTSQDLPLHDDEIRNALKALAASDEAVRRALGDNYDSVPPELPHRDALFSTLVLYSVADPARPGATEADVMFSVLDPDENPVEIKDSLRQLKQVAFNLHVENDRYLFKAAENPHARINAMARSGAVTADAVRDHIEAALFATWGGRARTALHTGDKAQLETRLRELRHQRPRYILSTKSLSGRARLQLQNLDADRNVVLLVEPRIRQSTGGASYSVHADEDLIHHARRFEATRLLLESSPGPEARAVYENVRNKEESRLRKAISERYGVYISWNRAGPSTSDVDDGWYEVNTLDAFGADDLLRQIRRNHSSLDDVAYEVAELWTTFRHQPVDNLCTHFDRTPGLPVPFDHALVPAAVRKLHADHTLGLLSPDGRPLSAKAVEDLDVATMRGCIIVDPATIDDDDDPVLHTHPRASAQWNPTKRCVELRWTYPDVPPGDTVRTLVQRYTTARQWTEGEAYPVGIDHTHDANRYYDAGAAFDDDDGLRTGEWYHYYVFLEHNSPGQDPRYVLSRRIDVGVPIETAPLPPNEVAIDSQPSQTKLVAEIERVLYQAGSIPSDARIRKLQVTIHSVVDDRLRTTLAPKLSERATDALEASADLTYTVRGDWNRGDVITLARALPRFEPALYAATISLKLTEED